jgi:P450-derived glycosyltransferase activator
MANLTDSELGGMMQLARGTQWYVGMFGDPYALVLRSQTDDPNPCYEKIREAGPLYLNPLGTWVCGSHAVAAEVLADKRFDVCGPDGEPAGGQLLALEDSFLGLGREGSERLRAAAAAPFGPEAVEQHRPLVERVARRLIDKIGRDVEFDLVDDFAEPLGAAVLAELLDVGEADRAGFFADCAALGPALDSEVCPQRLAPARALITALGSLRSRLSADKPSGLLGEHAAEADALAIAMLLAVSGARTTANLVSQATLALLAEPRFAEELAEDPSLAVDVIEETWRHSPPAHLQSLIAQADVELAGQVIPAGSQVVVVLGAANRDPAVHPDPDRFDPHRASGPEPSALRGILHHELLAPFAALQAEVALRLVTERLPALRHACPVVWHRRAPVTRRLAHAPLAVGRLQPTPRSPR